MGAMSPSDAQLDLEFAWTPFDVPKCRDPYTIDQNCRRPAGHEGDHAAGFGESRARWAAAE
jgi:hypothetical protein